MNWDDLRLVLVLSRRGTLSAAARELGVTQPTVGRRLAALERRLGAKLFVRSSDGFSLSSSGERARAQAERMEEAALAVERGVAGRDEGMRGTVRVTASEWLVTNVLADVVGSLGPNHPELRIELVADQRHLNLARREADLALRPRPFEHDAIVQRATAKLAFGLYASRAYLVDRGTPTAHGGADHVLIAMTEDAGDVARAWLASVLPLARQGVRTNGRDAMTALAVAGAGLACLARIVGDAIPCLERVEVTPAPPTPTLWMGMHRDARDTPRVAAVATHVAAQLKAKQAELCPPG